MKYLLPFLCFTTLNLLSCNCMDVRFIPNGTSAKVDGLRILLDSRNEDPLTYLIPYHFKNKKVEFGEEEVYKGERYCFKGKEI